MFKVASISWDSKQRNWTIIADKCRIKSDKKGILEISINGQRKSIYIHKNIFDFLKIFYKADEDTNDYINIEWAASSLYECIFFIQDDADLQKGISYFYRTLERIEDNEDLKGNKHALFTNRSQLSHGLFFSYHPPQKNKKFG
jgi:hypothetical protein